MSTITLTNELTNATTADADEVMENFEDITTVVNGAIDEDNIAATTALSVASLEVSGATTLTGAQTLTGATTCSASLSVGTTLAVTGATTLSSTLAVTGKTTVAQTVQTVTSYTPDAAGTATLTVNLGNFHYITMPAGNITIAVSGESVGQCFLVKITQDAIGSRTITAWQDTVTWAGGSAPTLTTTGAKSDIFGFIVTAADSYIGVVVAQNI